MNALLIGRRKSEMCSQTHEVCAKMDGFTAQDLATSVAVIKARLRAHHGATSRRKSVTPDDHD
ncbi:protein of unknown function [Methylocella tundrae]|uniref:Uncharacterized protein n=1 Tax=Methylocella tundrae TaxID=227605 RepID=A0A4U8Z508_METTU|nr:protein of unknown function [Methylocella tundrae]